MNIPALHLISIGASNTDSVMPDLIAETRDIKTGQVGPLEPVRLHIALMSSAGPRTLLEEEHSLSSLSQAVRQGDASRTRSNDDVVVGLFGVNRLADALGGGR